MDGLGPGTLGLSKFLQKFLEQPVSENVNDL